MDNQKLLVPGVRIQGATYLGICTAPNGSLYALLHLDDKPDSRRTHKEQLDWANGLNADLPTRQEVQMLIAVYEYLGRRLDSGWCWTKETCSWNASFAWSFYSGGNTNYIHESAAGGALAFRRLTLESFSSLAELAASIEVV